MSEYSEYVVGEVVRLKSGGPNMTVEQIGDFSLMGVAGHDQAKYVWFVGTKRQQGVFEFPTLDRVVKGARAAFAVME
jgi:uncharacterized protein YodC (DUF2158 family)